MSESGVEVVLVGRSGYFEDWNLSKQSDFDSLEDLKQVRIIRSNVDNTKVTKTYWPVDKKDMTGRDIFVEGEIDGE